MILACLLLMQTPAWPAIATKAVHPFYKDAPGSGVILESGTTIKATAWTEETLLFPLAETKFKIGTATLLFEKGGLSLDNGRSIPSLTAKTGYPLDLAITKANKDVKIYANGQLFTTLKLKTPALRFETEGLGGQTIATASYPRALTAAEIKKNADAGLKLADTLPDSEQATLDLKLSSFTEVPDPARIKPYRNALIAQEYTLTGFIDGHVKGLKQGSKIRVFRYGVLDGKKTDVQKQVKGSPAKFTVQLFSKDAALSREYQIDDLDTDTSATYYVETSAKAK